MDYGLSYMSNFLRVMANKVWVIAHEIWGMGFGTNQGFGRKITLSVSAVARVEHQPMSI